jgi:uncharacterized membrane protein YedE/YeeE
VLSRCGFTRWDELNAMFTFRDPRLLLTFISAVVIMAVAWAVIRKLSSPRWKARRLHRGVIPGGLLFGVGWALAGACPSAVVAELGEGQLTALWILAGIFGGNWLYAVLQPKLFRWPTESCTDD